MGYLDIIRRMEQSKDDKQDSPHFENHGAPPLAKKEKSPLCPDSSVQAGTGKPVFWEGADGTIRQGTCLLLASNHDCGRLWGWIGIEAEDGWHWVREDRLRSRRDYEAQSEMPTPLCAKCGASAWLRWAGGALLCAECEGKI